MAHYQNPPPGGYGAPAQSPQPSPTPGAGFNPHQSAVYQGPQNPSQYPASTPNYGTPQPQPTYGPAGYGPQPPYGPPHGGKSGSTMGNMFDQAVSTTKPMISKLGKTISKFSSSKPLHQPTPQYLENYQNYQHQQTPNQNPHQVGSYNPQPPQQYGPQPPVPQAYGSPASAQPGQSNYFPPQSPPPVPGQGTPQQPFSPLQSPNQFAPGQAGNVPAQYQAGQSNQGPVAQTQAGYAQAGAPAVPGHPNQPQQSPSPAPSQAQPFNPTPPPQQYANVPTPPPYQGQEQPPQQQQQPLQSQYPQQHLQQPPQQQIQPQQTQWDQGQHQQPPPPPQQTPHLAAPSPVGSPPPQGVQSPTPMSPMPAHFASDQPLQHTPPSAPQTAPTEFIAELPAELPVDMGNLSISEAAKPESRPPSTPAQAPSSPYQAYKPNDDSPPTTQPAFTVPRRAVSISNPPLADPWRIADPATELPTREFYILADLIFDALDQRYEPKGTGLLEANKLLESWRSQQLPEEVAQLFAHNSYAAFARLWALEGIPHLFVPSDFSLRPQFTPFTPNQHAASTMHISHFDPSSEPFPATVHMPALNRVGWYKSLFLEAASEPDTLGKMVTMFCGESYKPGALQHPDLAKQDKAELPALAERARSVRAVLQRVCGETAAMMQAARNPQPQQQQQQQQQFQQQQQESQAHPQGHARTPSSQAPQAVPAPGGAETQAPAGGMSQQEIDIRMQQMKMQQQMNEMVAQQMATSYKWAV